MTWTRVARPYRRVEMEIVCPECKEVSRLPQERPYHAGFSNQGFLYCDACPALLKFSSYNKIYTSLVHDRHPWMLSDAEMKNVESHLRACQCGGHFRFAALPRCSFCMAELPSVLPGIFHYIEMGVVLDADEDSSIWNVD